jgi:hypothetical protein
MPKKEILEITERAIQGDLGSLDDIPYELANTIANVYYKYFLQQADMMKRATNPGWIPEEMKRETNMKAAMDSFIEKWEKLQTDFDAASEFIKSLRGIDKREKPNLYQYSVNFILDCLKYDIKNAQGKTGLRRTIERKLKKNTIQEIPSLIDLLDLQK